MTAGEVYSEPDSKMHEELINQIIPSLFTRPDKPNKGDKVVDLGCGPGIVLDKLVEQGLDKKDLIGVTMGEDDLQRTKDKGYECYNYDMTFTEFEDNSFDYGIVRHCLEHSTWPYLTLMEFNRIMKMGGRMYIEMPAPGGDRRLEHWQNHYSVMNQIQWGSLMVRAGFEYASDTYPVKMRINNEGPELNEPYHWYVITKIADRQDYAPADNDKMKELVKICQDVAAKRAKDNPDYYPVDKK